MPPKNRRARNKRGNEEHAMDEAAIDDIVRAIEGDMSKKGMTKAQANSLEVKSVYNAMNRAQSRRTACSTDQLRNAIKAQQALQQTAVQDAVYVNKFIPLSEMALSWHEVVPGKYIRYEQYNGSDADMNYIVDLFTRELSEPYSSFTYQYFVMGWPDLCITIYGVESDQAPDDSVRGEKVGAVVSRVTRKGPGMKLRGYVAMFAVEPHFRGFRLGSRLVALTVELMRRKDCDEVYLETPTTNERALALYLSLGFAKTKFLPRYYLDHSDAVRLKLWLKTASTASEFHGEGVSAALATAAVPAAIVAK